MTNLIETSQWEEGIFQIETNTPVLGGRPALNNGAPVDGHANAQALQLANRTTFLRNSKVSSDVLASDVGSELVGYKVPFNGSAKRSLGSRLSDTVSVRDFGAIGDGQYHPLSERFTTLGAAQLHYAEVPVTSLDQSIDWAAIQAALNAGKNAYAPAGRYVLTDTLTFPSGVVLEGDGHGFWDIIFHNRPKTWEGTSLLFKGTGVRQFSAYGITGMKYSGGRRSDPDDPGVAYAMTSFMQADASGGTRASPRPFSAAVAPKVLNGSSHWGLRNLRVCPWMGEDGTSGYSNRANQSLGDDWDIGVAILDSEYCVLDGVQVVGYWRMAGAAMLSFGQDEYGVSERNMIRDSKLQGYVGLLCRSGDVWRVLAKTADTVTIRYSEEHYWPASGAFEAPGNLHYTYAGITVSGTDLTFTGVAKEADTASDPLTAGISSIRNRRRGTGYAGCQIENTFMHGLDHVSGLKSTDLGFPYASRPLEMSGYPMRGLQFYNSKCQTHEKLAGFLHNANDIQWFGGQFEGRNSLLIASPQNLNLSASDPLCPAADGDTLNLRFTSTLLSSVDTRLFKPRSLSDDMRTFNPQSRTSADLLLEPLDGQDMVFRLAAGKNLYVSDRTNASILRVTETGNVLIQKGGQLSLTGGAAYINADASANIIVRNGTTGRLQIFGGSGNVAPGADNTQSLGTSTARWTQLYAGTSTINTSDERTKQDIQAVPDAVLDAWASVEYAEFRFIDAVNLKAGDARLHVGVIAQRVKDAFETAGIDPFSYGVLCYDEWDAQCEPVTATRWIVQQRTVQVTDEHGELYEALVDEEVEEVYETGELREVSPAGNRYGIRYEEALALEAALMRRTTQRLEARLAALEGK